MHHLNRILVLLMCCALGACGGSGGSSASPAAVGGTPQTGGVTLLVGDAPGDFDEILVTMESAALIGEDDQQRTLDLAEPIRLDLLELRNITEQLIDTDIPVGRYCKIRLQITDLVLNKLDDAGVVTESESPPLPANGRIDLNPQGCFDIVAGEDLIIEIDFDLERAIHIVSTGNGQVRFRPVVLVDVHERADRARIARLFGRVANLNEAEATFDLCKPNDEGECVSVHLADDAFLLDANGVQISLAAVPEGDTVILFGRFGVVEDGVFEALAVAHGARDDLRQLEGTIDSDPSTNPVTIRYEDRTYLVEFLEGVILFDGARNRVGIDDLSVGQALEFWAVREPGSDLHTVLIGKLENDEDEAVDEAEGRLIAYDAGTMTLETDAGERLCVVPMESAEVTLISENSAGVAVSEMVTLAAFTARFDAAEFDALEVEAHGSTMIEGCLQADRLLLEIED